MDNMLQEAIKLFKEPYDDRPNRSPDAPTLVDVAEAMQTTTLKVRKILVTVGHYSTETSRKVQELYNSGYSVPEIMKETGLSKASVNTYLPYSKGAYKLEEPTYMQSRRDFIESGRRHAECCTIIWILKTLKNTCGRQLKHLKATHFLQRKDFHSSI